MVYRDYKTAQDVRYAQHQEAKAILEEFAEDRTNRYSDGRGKMGDALETMGFKKKELDHNNSHKVPVYVREKKDITEILFDDLSIFRMSLYQVQTGQDLQEWYNSISDFNVWREEHNSEVFAIGLSAMAVSLVGGVALGYLLKPHVGGLVGGAISPLIAGSLTLLYKKMKKHPLHKQTIAKGSEALRYIANNTEYETPQLRIATRPRIIDAEFTDEQAELEVSATAEQIREEKTQVKRK